MKNFLYIIITQNKFTEFYWIKEDLDEFLKFTDVEVWDISKLINIKLNMQKNQNETISKELDSMISDLVKDQRYQFLNNTSSNNDMRWLLEDSNIDFSD